MGTVPKLFVIALPIFLAIDLLWLGVVARTFYREQLGVLMRPEVNWGAALSFYVLFVAGIVILAVAPAIEKESLLRAVGLGATLGLVAYAAFDLTNLAVLQGYPATMAWVDMIWGTILTGTVSGLTYKVFFLLG